MLTGSKGTLHFRVCLGVASVLGYHSFGAELRSLPLRKTRPVTSSNLIFNPRFLPVLFSLLLHSKTMAFCSESYLLLFLILAVDSFAQPNAPVDQSSYDASTYNNVLLAHGIVYAIAFALVFPTGALLLRLFPSRDLVWCHTAVQIVGIIFMFAGFGLGCWLCAQYSPVSKS
jgi:hypothetical protein